MKTRADEIVDELKKFKWDTFYDKSGIEMQSVMPDVKDPKRRFRYLFQWSLKHINKGDKVLDVGSNDGYLCYKGQEKGCEMTGLDVSKKMMESAKKQVPEATFIQGYAEKIPFEDGYFDVVNANQLLEHVKEPDIVVEEMLRVLKDKGRLLVTVPILNNLHTNEHIHHWGFYDVVKLFEKYGENFKIYWINKFIKFLPNTIEPYKKNLFAIKFIKGGGERDG